MAGAIEFGSVAPRLRADLVLLEADPLAAVGSLSKRAGVMVRGRWRAEAELRERLAAIASSAKAAR